MKKNRKMVLSFALSCVLLTSTVLSPAAVVSAESLPSGSAADALSASSASEPAVTFDSEGPVYTGDYLLTINKADKIDAITYRQTANPDQGLDDSWEATGIPGAQGVSKPAAAVSGQSQSSVLTTPDYLKLQTGYADPEVSGLLGDSEKTVYKVGDTKNFKSYFYYGSDGTKPTDFTAECVAVTDNCTFWYNAIGGMEGLSTKEDVISLADTIQQCAARIRDTFGSSLNMDIDHDGKVAFVFYPANDLAAGFFTPQDFTDNKMDMLNITTRTNGSSGSAAINNNLGTVVHEWQHLINYSRTGSTLGFSENDNEQQYGSRNYTWLNEAFSQNSMRINGYTGMVNTQTLESTVYLQNYNYSLTQPFVFQGLYVPQKHPLIVGVYVYWYLFGAYLASQTEGYPGGGNEIYNTVLSAVQDDVVNPDNGIDYGLLGKCDNDTLEKALTDIGYLGTGENAKAKWNHYRLSCRQDCSAHQRTKPLFNRFRRGK